jgi:hypothetical protein
MTSERDERPTRPSAETREEEERDAQVRPGNRTASVLSSDEPQSEPPVEVDEEVAEHYREMTERGAHQQGEGRTP